MEDVRSPRPNDDGYRRGRFKVGWSDGANGKTYTPETLEQLTWQNAGWRFGSVLGVASDELIDEFYDLCVRQQGEVVTPTLWDENA